MKDDDDSRLVYADELQEKHDPRGEFIALQIHAARLPPTDPRRNELLVRATQLLEVHRKDWSPLGLDWQFERGFPTALQLHVSALRRHEAALHEVATLKDLEVRFTSATPEDLDRLLTLPLLQKVPTLRFNWHTPPQLAVDLLQQPWVAKLERLQFSWVMLPVQVWQVLGRVESPARHLAALDLMLADARDDFVQLLDPAPWPHLKWLRLSNGRLGTRSCEVLAQLGLFPALEHLDVSWNRIGKQGAALLAKSPLIHQLTRLDLSHCQIGDEGCEALAQAGSESLRWLSVEHSRVTAEGVDLLRAGLPLLQVLAT